jgi:diguanylate cyclase (GGDEF)-like protein/PAS domain S-box-containing protein
MNELSAYRIDEGDYRTDFRTIANDDAGVRPHRAGDLGEHYERMVELGPHLFWACDAQGRLIALTRQWTDLTGRPLPSVLGGWEHVVHPRDRARVKSSWRKAVSGAAAFDVEMRICAPGRGFRWYRARATRDPVSTNHYGTLVDIDERKSAELAMCASDALSRAILCGSVECIKLLSIDGCIELINPAGLSAMEIDDLGAVQGRPWEQFWPEETRPQVRQAVRAAQRGEAGRVSAPCPTTKGRARWWDVVVTPVRQGNRVTQLLVISRDVTEHREQAERLRRASEQDALTGLPNRAAFYDGFRRAIDEARRNGELVGLLVLDLDHFKHVNDSLGHPAGDHLLGTIAERLCGSVRGSDTVARLGGDEFAIVLRNVPDSDALMEIGQSILGRLQVPTSYEGRVISGSASLGGAIFPRDGADVDELLKNADIALYSTKAAGRGGTTIFKPQLRAEAQGRISKLNLARQIIRDEAITPFYQPKVELETGRVVGFEALLRWHHHRNGTQSPETIWEAFDDYELATKIGAQMQQAVIRDLAAWQAAGIDVGRISINASPAEFLRDDFAERLFERLHAGGVAPNRVEIEVTEQVFLNRGAAYVTRALNQLSAAGVTIALDDFGTGYSSFPHLKSFTVDTIKIDQSFVRTVHMCREDATIVTAMLGLADGLGITSVAEGIETEAHRDFLLVHGCRFGQGFLFGPAVPAAQVPALL